MAISDRIRLRNLRTIADRIARLELKYHSMTDQELQSMTASFKEKLQHGSSLDALLPDAYAAVRETCRRVRGEFPYYEQLLGAISMHQGNTAEMKTGEGKSLTATMPAYLNALTGKGVHIITVNEYLAERDQTMMEPVFSFLGLSTGLSLASSSKSSKRNAYLCDITYTTNSEAGFDYLRDNMAMSLSERVQRGFHYAIIDEVDSILIDEAGTPLIISDNQTGEDKEYINAATFAKELTDSDVILNKDSKTVFLNDAGIRKAEKHFHTGNLYIPEHKALLQLITNAVKARFILHKNIDYIIKDNQIMIVDPNTGRVMPDREWSNGLHQAVSAKEGLPVRNETVTKATVTYQNYFRMYEKLCGMSGTAKTDEDEFRKVYNMNVDVITSHKPLIRQDYADAVFRTEKEKYEAVIQETVKIHKTGQPVLIGTVSVETSEMLSEKLKKQGIPHEVLNARNDAKEAAIIAAAGEKGAVTIATNMAGRGTDIRLSKESASLCGLAVIGTQRHESKRIDDQLRGRSGRQGDPGRTQFFVSLEDELAMRYGNENLRKTLVSDTGTLSAKTVGHFFDLAQKRAESIHYDARKTMLNYDNIISQHRTGFYEERNKVLSAGDIHVIVLKMLRDAAEEYAGSFVEIRDKPYSHISQNAKNTARIYGDFAMHAYAPSDLQQNGTVQEIAQRIFSNMKLAYDFATEPVRMILPAYERMILLGIFDEEWTEHLMALDRLRSGIGLRGYAGVDPVLIFAKESRELYDLMTARIKAKTVMALMRLRTGRERMPEDSVNAHS